MPTTTTGNATNFITFSRGTLATVTDADGKIKWAPHNLLLASEQFDASSWTKNGGATVTANSVTAPNSTTTADTYNQSGATHYMFQSLVLGVASRVTFSCFFKANVGSHLRMFVADTATVTDGFGCWANISTGVLGTTGTTGTGATFNSASVQSIGSGWYQISITGQVGTNTAIVAGLFIADGDNSGTRLNPASCYIWGASLTRADLGGMQNNASAYPYYNPSTPRNLLGYSEAFDNAAWTKSGLLAFGSGSTANAIAAPNGSLSADLLTENTSAGGHSFASGTITTSNGGKLVVSLYAKANGRSFLALYEGTSNCGKYFNLSSGTLGSNYLSAPVSADITPVGDGWYRCSMVVNSGATAIIAGYLSVDGTSISYTGNGTSGIYLWGAQLSDSASLDAYVPNFGPAPSAAAAHGPRLDYDPVTLAAKGLLVEEARANLLQRSQEFDNAYWTKSNATITANASIAPDGTMTADALIGTTTLSAKFMSRASLTSTVGTFSVYAKAAGETVISLWLVGATIGASFTLTGNGSTAFLGSVTGATASITPVGNGWYRCIYSNTSATTTAHIYLRDGAGYTGDGTSGALFWGAQLEAGSFATSYIQNVDSAAGVTRNADVASVGVSQFPYSASEGTLVAAFDYLGGSTVNANLQSAASLRDTSASSAIYIYNGGGKVSAYCVLAGVDQAYLERNTVAANVTTKLAFAFKTNDFAASQDGGVVATDTSGSLPSPNVLAIGSSGSNTAYVNGHIRQITYLPRRISNADLIARTA